MKKRNRNTRITQAAIMAWRAGDYHALHAALGLYPWEASPLPRSIKKLGVNQDDVGRGPRSAMFNDSIPQAKALQLELVEAAGGWPET